MSTAHLSFSQALNYDLKEKKGGVLTDLWDSHNTDRYYQWIYISTEDKEVSIRCNVNLLLIKFFLLSRDFILFFFELGGLGLSNTNIKEAVVKREHDKV